VNAREWLESGPTDAPWDVVVLGAPISRASISPSSAHTTPAAFREALARFSTYDGDHAIDLTDLRIRDLGDVEGDADGDVQAAHARIEAACGEAVAMGGVVVVIGGDNSLTFPALRGSAGGALDDGWGLVTFDAHHDVRDAALYGGPRNGTPVRDLIEAGLPGRRVAQIGVHGFANAREHHDWAAAQGVHVRRAVQVRAGGITSVLDSALSALERNDATRFYVDFDLDVLDRAFAPACPASMPGGLRPVDLQEAAYVLGTDPRIAVADLTEVDAAADVAGMTVRTMAAVFLAFCAGVCHRRRLQRQELA
jgi:formiminoglutamase